MQKHARPNVLADTFIGVEAPIKAEQLIETLSIIYKSQELSFSDKSNVSQDTIISV